MEEKIKQIQITPINPKGSLVAFGSCLYGDLWLGHIGIHTKASGSIRLVFPAKKVKEKNLQIFYPVSEKLNQKLTHNFDKKIKELNLFNLNEEE